MRKHNIDKLTDDTMQSLDGIKRAGPKPFLFTRVMAAINNASTATNMWTKAAAFISRPGVAITGLLLIMFLNVAIFIMNKNNDDISVMVQNSILIKDEFANAGTIYDFENPDQQ